MVHPREDKAAEALARHNVGDPKAFDQLLRSVGRFVRAYVKRRLKSFDDAEIDDISQKVWEAVLGSAKKFDPARSRAVSWILLFARRRCVDAVRAREARREETLGQQGAAALPNRGMDEATLRELKLDLRAAMGSLPPKLRRVVELFLENRTFEDIAAEVKEPVMTAHDRFTAACQRMRRGLAGHEPEED